ncbi:MAG TPA: 3-hydroxy-3-methylglutaryl-CoA reductase [Alphaproteobacteria bacterium]|nr:3-hydroxy-3-methylglutaryl-CoA reductase [Alphaproteobacteria bacterium]
MATRDDIKQQFAAGKIRQQDLETCLFQQVYGSDPKRVRDACQDAAVIRCELIEAQVGVPLSLIKRSQIDNGTLTAAGMLTGIEMKVGAALIPMGIAGPVTVHGEFAKGEYYIPLATNEAALVAGVQRGIKAINLAGGMKALVTFDGMARAPMIEAPDIEAARALCRRVVEDAALVKQLGKEIKDPFVRLEYIEPYQLGTKVVLRLVCKTGDAMGMNGVTKAAADISRALLAMLPGWKLITISSNMCTDKKASHMNVLLGRGKSVQAEVLVPDAVLKQVFKAGVTSRSVERVVFHKCYLGSCLSGTLGGFNVNAANTLAAFFAATGQDLAQVITSASAFVQADAIEGGLHFMLTMPSLEVATIGGGANFGTAKEALTLMGCGGCGTSPDDNANVKRLAEICCVAVAALELNTACAQAAGYEMADSHVALARGEKE